MPVGTRGSTAEKPAAAATQTVPARTARAPRQTPEQIALDAEKAKQTKELKKQAKLDAEAAKAARLSAVNAEAMAGDAAYSTPVPVKALSKRKAASLLQRTESTTDLVQYEAEVFSMPPPARPNSRPNQINRSAGVVTPSGDARDNTLAKKPSSGSAKSAASVAVLDGGLSEVERPKPRPVGRQPLKHDKICTGDDVLMAPPPSKELQRNTVAIKPAGPTTTVGPQGGARERPAAASSRPLAVNTRQPRRALAKPPLDKDGSVTEEDLQAIIVEVDANSVTEDDSEAPEPYDRPYQRQSSDEFSPPEPPKKKARTQTKAKAKADTKGKGKSKVEDAGGNRQQSSEVEIVAESKVQKKQTAEGKAIKKVPAVNAIPPAKQVHQKTYQDKMDQNRAGANAPVGSNTYNKKQVQGLRDNIGTWSKKITADKPPSERSNSTPSLTSQSVTSTRRPPSSVVSRASALSNGIRVTGARDNGLHEEGAISDRDETTGEELKAKNASPVKGGVRVSSEDKIKLEPGNPAPMPGVRKVSRSTNKSMPSHFQEGPTWKTYIVPSIIKWAGTQPKVFKIPNATLVPVLQTVCRQYFDDNTITFKLCNDPTVGLITQRLTDTFRGPIGSAAISILLAFLASHEDMQDSDTERVKWCKDQLRDYKFLYGDSTHPKQKRWRNPYQSGLVVQTFAVYISAIKNARWLLGMFPGSEDPNTPHPEPKPALALATAAVERALKFVANRKITLETIRLSQVKDSKIPLITPDINPATKKGNPQSVAFSEELCGDMVKDYISNITDLRKSDMDRIITSARRFSRATAPFEDEDDEDGDISAIQAPNQRSARVHIPHNYESDDEEDESDTEPAIQNDQQYNSDNDEKLGRNDYEEEYDAEVDDMEYDDGHPVEDGGEPDGNVAYSDDQTQMDYEDGRVPMDTAY